MDFKWISEVVNNIYKKKGWKHAGITFVFLVILAGVLMYIQGYFGKAAEEQYNRTYPEKPTPIPTNIPLGAVKGESTPIQIYSFQGEHPYDKFTKTTENEYCYEPDASFETSEVSASTSKRYEAIWLNQAIVFGVPFRFNGTLILRKLYSDDFKTDNPILRYNVNQINSNPLAFDIIYGFPIEPISKADPHRDFYIRFFDKQATFHAKNTTISSINIRIPKLYTDERYSTQYIKVNIRNFSTDFEKENLRITEVPEGRENIIYAIMKDVEVFYPTLKASAVLGKYDNPYFDILTCVSSALNYADCDEKSHKVIKMQLNPVGETVSALIQKASESKERYIGVATQIGHCISITDSSLKVVGE